MQDVLGFWVLLPPVVAIVVVLWSREVIAALLTAILAAEGLLLFAQQGSVLAAPAALVERVLQVLLDSGNLKVLAFSLIVGAFLALIRYSGGVNATVNSLVSLGLAKTPRRAGLMTYIIGLLLFVESNLSMLTAGIVSRGLYDRFGMSRARLAYILDSTAAPVCIIIMLNGWGLFVYALLKNQGLENPYDVLVGSIGFNFYAWIALLFAFYTVISGRVHGALARFEQQHEHNNEKHDSEAEIGPGKRRYMLLPFASLVVTMVASLWWTGNGNLGQADGALAILYAVLAGCMVAYIVLILERRFVHQELVDLSFKGMAELLPIVTILLLSITLGSAMKQLGTGYFVATLVSDHIALWAVIPLLFIAASIIAFTTGTSWGTFAIMIPIAVPLALNTGLPMHIMVAAALGGGIFGDHCSPISDSTVMSSLAAGCDVLDHVLTQLPYALVGAGITTLLYLMLAVV